MSESETHPDDCPNCVQSGLPLLLTRYAVARSDDEVQQQMPVLQAPFHDVVADHPLPADVARYTLRLLRGGYVYAYHQARDEWTAWQVNDYGDLGAIDIRDKTPPAQNDALPATCSRHGVSLLSKCLIVQDAAHATLLWLAYSSAPWTRSVWMRHQDTSYRQEHMRCINVAAWRANTHSQPHLTGLEQAPGQVAELYLAQPSTTLTASRGEWGVLNAPAMTVLPGAHALEHSLVERANYAISEVDRLMSQAGIAAGHPQVARPAMVALDDPIGIISDLNQLAIARILEWEGEPERREKLQSAASIAVIERAVCQGAFEDVAYRRKRNALLGRGVVTVLGGRTNAAQLARPLAAWDDHVFAVEDEDEVLEKARTSWKKYRRHLREKDAHTHWLEHVHAPAQARFYEEAIADLDRAWVAWWQASSFKRHMQSNFDSMDTTSGVLYQEAVTILLRDAASRGVVLGYLMEQLQRGDVEDPAAVLLRAQMWNQDALLAVWKKAMQETGIGPGTRDWLAGANGLSNALKTLLDAESAGKLGAMFQGAARLVEQLSGPLTRMVGAWVGRGMGGAASLLPTQLQVGLLTALAQSSTPGIELVDLSGYTTPKRARNALAMAVTERAGLNAANQARAVAAHAIAAPDAAMEGGRFKFHIVALVDADRLRLFKALNAKAVMSGVSRQAELARTLTVVDLYDAMRGSFAKLGKASFAYGMASLIFASASLSELSTQYAKALPRQQAMLGANFAAGVGALVGDSAMLLGEMGSKLPWFSRKLAEPMGRWVFFAETRAALVHATGRWLSGIAGVVLGGMTVYEGVKDFKLSAAYGAGMIVGGSATMLAALLLLGGVAAPAALLLMIIAAVVTVVVSWFKPDEIERWIDKSIFFGKNNSGVFSDVECQLMSMKELQGRQ